MGTLCTYAYRMDCASAILILLAFIPATCGQTVILTGFSAVEQGMDFVFTCTGGTSPYNFAWTDLSVVPSVNIFLGGEETYPSGDTKYTNFEVLEDGVGTSTMTIRNTQIEDEGQYRCGEGQATDDANFTVEVKYALSSTLKSTLVDNIDMYEATCEALGGRPNKTITWMLGDGESPCDDIVVTNLVNGPDLFSKRSVCTFQADGENNGQTLKCVISGHQVSALNGEEEIPLNIHGAPNSADIIEVDFQVAILTVSCNIDDKDQPTPRIRNYYIYFNDTLIHQSITGVNSVEVGESDFDLYTNFTCVAGNYLGNTTTTARYDPNRPTTLTPTTDPTTPNVGAIVGGVVGGIALIIIVVLVIKFVVKPECMGGSGFSFQALFACCKCSLPSNSGGSRKKPASSAVGSSNGSEKGDAEAPLKGVNEVVTQEDKIKPSAAPRTQSSIQHTTDNPEQAEYAMVDRKPGGGGKGGGDMPDKGYGAGQNEPAGMVYADLDLSAKAGHTEKQIPQNKDDVVVYSSILV